MKNKLKDAFSLGLILITAPFFLFKLGASSLVSWDEAWYASIARNILQSGDIFNLIWNGQPFFDHPPAGFWFQALSFKIFGISEFSARFPSAVAGMFTLITVYFLGKRLFARPVGLISALALSTAIWFTYRSRAADLDIFLTLFFALSIYLAIKSTDDHRYLYPFSISLSLLFLTKTGIPVVILPAVLVIFVVKHRSFRWYQFIAPLLIFIGFTSIWFVIQYLNHSSFLARYLAIGFPKSPQTSTFIQNLTQISGYLHSSIGKWYWPGILGLAAGLILFPRRIGILSLFALSFFLPFTLSLKGHIWHLVPLHPFMILAFFGFTYLVITKVTRQPILAYLVIFAFGLYYSYQQGRQNWYQFIDIPTYVSDEAILSRLAARSPHQFFIDDNYAPAAAFYSGKVVEKYNLEDLNPLFDGSYYELEDSNFMFITTQWRLDSSNIDPSLYTIIKTDRDKILLTRSADL